MAFLAHGWGGILYLRVYTTRLHSSGYPGCVPHFKLLNSICKISFAMKDHIHRDWGLDIFVLPVIREVVFHWSSFV